MSFNKTLTVLVFTTSALIALVVVASHRQDRIAMQQAQVKAEQRADAEQRAASDREVLREYDSLDKDSPEQVDFESSHWESLQHSLPGWRHVDIARRLLASEPNRPWDKDRARRHLEAVQRGTPEWVQAEQLMLFTTSLSEQEHLQASYRLVTVDTCDEYFRNVPLARRHLAAVPDTNAVKQTEIRRLEGRGLSCQPPAPKPEPPGVGVVATCQQAVRAQATYPGTVKFPWFSGGKRTEGTGRVHGTFTVRNLFGTELPYHYSCLADSRGNVVELSVEPD